MKSPKPIESFRAIDHAELVAEIKRRMDSDKAAIAQYTKLKMPVNVAHFKGSLSRQTT